MNQQMRNFLCGLLTLWTLALIGLAFVVVKDLHAPTSAFISIFQKTSPPVPKASLVSEKKVEKKPVVVEKVTPIVQKDTDVLPLLPIGRKAGKAVLQRGSLEKTAKGYIFTVPYEGTVYNYTTYSIASKRARIIDVRGDIRCNYYALTFDKAWDVRMIQMASHEGYARISVIGSARVRTFEQTVRYTSKALKIYLNPVMQ